MKKKIVVIIIVLALLILLFPARYRLRDGGSTVYSAVLYQVTKYHCIGEGHGEYYGGWNIKIFGIEIYDNMYPIES